MSGLLGSAIAGGVRQVTQGRLNDIDRQEQFNMQNALLRAREDMELRIRESGVQMQEQSAGRERERVKGYFKNGDGHEVDMATAADNARRDGDIDTAKGLIGMTPKADGKVFDIIKLDDGSVMSYDKSTGTGTIILPGNKKVQVPKNEFELAWEAADGDPKKAMELLVQQKSKVAASGRTTPQPTLYQETKADFINANRENPELVKNGILTSKGLQEFRMQGKEGQHDEKRVEGRDEAGNKVTTVSRYPSGKAPVFDNDPLGLRK